MRFRESSRCTTSRWPAGQRHAAHAQAPPPTTCSARATYLDCRYEQAELTGKFTIAADGTITFPLIGRVEAGGKTARAVEVEIRTRLADGYLRSPQVTVGSSSSTASASSWSRRESRAPSRDRRATLLRRSPPPAARPNAGAT
jgi:hypothetical protein